MISREQEKQIHVLSENIERDCQKGLQNNKQF